MSDTPDAPRGFADGASHWNTRFSKDGYYFGTTPNAWLAEQAHRWQPGQHVLCVADGEGRNSVWLAERGLRVDAFDISAVGVDKARRLAAERSVSVNFQVSDCDGFDWGDGRYDGVAAIFVQFAEPALRARMFASMVRCLKPGGLLVLQGYTPRQLQYKTGGPGQLAHLYTPELLRDAFSALQILELRDYEAEVSEGPGHSGMSALIGLVARRP